MTDETILRARQNCCRLCLAPDSECISILNSYAADKEPLAAKIQSCVNIKVSPADRLSLRICHACISYLNSWQSFKNRCVASQSKQRNWLEFCRRTDNNISGSSSSSNQQQQKAKHQQVDERNQEQHRHHQSPLATSILDGITSLKKRKSLTVYPIPVHIKDEPIDDDYEMAKQHHDESDEIDPTLFLERTDVEGVEPLLQKEQHLASLGLKHAQPGVSGVGGGNNHQMQGFMESNYSFDGNHSLDQHDKTMESIAANEVKEASCRACNLKFSTRANARRHERNLHPNLFVLSSSTPNATPTTTPTAALTALQIQRQQQQQQQLHLVSGSGSASGRGIFHQPIHPLLMGGQFDYDDPERYQHLLTEDKIAFIQENDDFLQQYQSMTCNCCLRTHATYKNFMAHMRKKYFLLPRNLCFKCLKQNDSKALFISHLKKRNCINLYRIFHGCARKLGDGGSGGQLSPDKLRAKELLVNKIYECRICSKHFRLKLEFRSHVYEEHADAQKKDVSPGHCGFCGLDIDDPSERKRHYNNMDCIVILRCITCDEKFDNHQKFLDHVYSKHLANNNDQQKGNLMRELAASLGGLGSVADDIVGNKKEATAGAGASSSADETRGGGASKPQFSSRLPQSCTICGQHYNNYNNVLRHMESKHPDQLPQTYKCIKCHVGYPRLMNLREHMVINHGMKIDKARNNSFDYFVDSPGLAGGGGGGKISEAYTGRYDYVMKDLLSITNGGIGGGGGDGTENDDDDNKSDSPMPKRMRMLDSSGNNLKECPICSAVFSNNIGLSNHMRSHASAAEAANASKTQTAEAGTSISTTTTTSGSKVKVLEKKTAVSQVNAAIFKRSLALAADRRFRRMRCRICQKRFSSKKSYRRHMLVDHQIRNVQFIKCKLCDAEFAYEKGLKVHMFKIHNTLLKEEMIVKQFECDICSIVYRTEDQLLQHKKSVHGNDSAQVEDDVLVLMKSRTATSAAPGADQSMESAPLYWYQCKYCPSNFNTNKKLAIHINSHEEFDSNDYSCKDCGNVYSGRKSLWVHRYKKHPPIADPSECSLCKKVFFDKQMLLNHTPICNRKPVPLAAPLPTSSAAAVDGSFYKHKTGDDDDLDVDAGRRGDGGDGKSMLSAIPTSKLKIKLPEVACTMCGMKFTDQELFGKHIKVHEMELYTDNPLAAMFDTGPADPNQFFLDRVNDNGEYACDICPKAFAQMTALKVHRKWHFRGDSKQTPAESNATATQPVLPPPVATKPVKRRRELKCEYCPSTFISSNNLRRHIAELHKSELSNWPEPPKIENEKYLHCARCEIKFETKKEWIDHKVVEAKVMKPFGPFQWGCDICGEYVSRKEKLIHHILAHMKERNGQTRIAGEQDYYPGESNSQDSLMSSGHRDGSGDAAALVGGGAYKQPSKKQRMDDDENDEDDDADADEAIEEEEEEEEEEADDEEDEDDEQEGDHDEEEDDESHVAGTDDVEVENMDNNANDGQKAIQDNEDGRRSKKHKLKVNHQTANDQSSSEAEDSPSYVEEDEDNGDDDDDDDEEEVDVYDNEDDEDDDDDDLEESATTVKEEKKRYACDLCQVYFGTSQELQKHVTSHFLNGPGSVTLTEITTKDKTKPTTEKNHNKESSHSSPRNSRSSSASSSGGSAPSETPT